MFTDKEVKDAWPYLFILILKNLPIKTKDIYVTHSWCFLTAEIDQEDCDYPLE